MKSPILRIGAIVALLVSFAAIAAAQVKVTALDVGTGECLVMALPGKHFIVYDTGDYASDDTKGMGETSRGHRALMAGLRRLIPPGGVIDLMILSHDDADHIGGAQFVLNNYEVKRLYWARDERGGDLYGAVKAAIEAEAAEGCQVVSMVATERPAEGSTIFEAGGAKLTFLTGCDVPPDDWMAGLGDSERKNAGSIVVRLTYAGKSVLVCGDAVGRKRDEKGKSNDPATKSRATESHMLALNEAGQIELKSDVLVAPHHGGDNASSPPFIKAAHPAWVVFCSGHDTRETYKHPRASAVERYLAEGLKPDHLLRTDFGDNDTEEEWQWGDTPVRDYPGDDDIEISISRSGTLKCIYASSQNRAKLRVLAKQLP